MLKKKFGSSFQNDLIIFTQLFSITLINVSLKWLFRLVASWPRLSQKFKFIKKFFAKNKVKPKLLVVEPYVIGNNDCENILVKKQVDFQNKKDSSQNKNYLTAARKNPLLILVQPAQYSQEYLNETNNIDELDNGDFGLDVNRDGNSLTKVTNLASIRKDSRSISNESQRISYLKT